METKKYNIVLSNGEKFSVTGNKMKVNTNTENIEIWNIAGKGHTAADDVLKAVVPKGSSVYVDEETK